jgi:mevalonate kinase
VFPLASKKLTLSWTTTEGDELQISGGDYSDAFKKALHLALEILCQQLPTRNWQFTIQSNIPVKAGLGSSAALSVAIVKFLGEIGLQNQDPFALALSLEDIFHGKSSGIDVAAVLEGHPILFQREQQSVPLALSWLPKLYLFDTGLRSSTKACVEQVIKLNRPDLDTKMGTLVEKAKDALETQDLDSLAQTMEDAAEIFRAWGLVPTEVEAGIKKLKDFGAIAVKPTGSGNGGYLLSLWKEAPPDSIRLIPLSAGS